MGVLSWLLFGLIAGAIAKLIMPGKDPGGCLITSVIGMLGSGIGGYIGTRLFGIERVTGFNGRSLGIAILGAIVLLAIYRLLISRREPSVVSRNNGPHDFREPRR
ncbi:MAG: GlsB/YeaQ/YmgE family stress response membrane protein [Longimicrobiales bacterium]